MSRFRYLTVVLSLLLALFLVACGSPETPAEPTEAPMVEEDSAEEEPVEEEEEAADSGAGLSAEDLAGDSGEVVEIRYINWDINQFPAYEECAGLFNEANPNINVTVENVGWGDYWTNLQTGMVAGGAADVFTNHLAKYPEFAAKEQILDIQPYVDADGVDVGIYLGELEKLWTRDGARFGLPKDWDTVSVIYNKALLEEAGVTVEELNEATWNYEDGGTFTEILQRITDAGVADAAYGADYPGTGAYGQTVFSMFAASTGWNFVDGLYATEYNYDDERFIGTMQWFQDQIGNGNMASYEDMASLGASAAFAAGNTVLTTDGSWMIGFYSTIEDMDVGFARLPIGPEGRKSMFNGLADSIWAGTEHPDEAWEWVKYAASAECEAIVGSYGVVFPATAEGTQNALEVYGERGLDVSAFTNQATEDGGTFLFPVTDNASEVGDIMVEALDAIYLGQAPAADILPAANDAVNATFGADAGSSGEATDSAGLDEEETEAEEAVAPEDVVDIRYINWDINQFPAYEECAGLFNAANPGINVTVENVGWGDYWTNLQTGMVAGGAADVFTNHLAKYPEFASKNQILDIQPYVDADGVDVGIYLGELEKLWTRDGARFGLPKDWDTVAVIYNKALLEEAGVTEEELNEATWNYEDGGTFTEILQRITDAGVADAAYGADYPGTGAYGQTVFSMFAASTGWNFVDNLYATSYNYDDERFIGTMQWFQDQIEAGNMASYEDMASLGASAAFAAGNTVLTTDGSWMIGFYSTIEGVDVGFARLPIGPEGRKSMFNGLADSIWAGTEHPDEAWEWVKYAASAECEAIVGSYGVVFPATAEGTQNALEVYSERGLDVSAFTNQATEDGGTFLFPVTDNASEIGDIMVETLDAIYLGQAPAADVLPAANDAVNATFGDVAPSDDAEEAEEDGAMDSGDVVDIRYINWDINQFPAYEECAGIFNEANPGINVTVENVGWGDYWTNLQTGMVAGGAADVFTNHLAKYPEFAAKEQILDIQPYVDADGVDVGIYLGELEKLWTRDGARFGLPKDWDTVAVIYNKALLEEAGVTEEELNEATWNYEDGGTFTEILQRITDAGVADAAYGADYPGTGAYGQTVFSMFAASTGWNFVDNLYATEYNYADERFIGTMQWFQDQIEAGNMASYEDMASLGASAAFAAGNTVLTTDGSWMIGFYSTIEGVDVGFARLPIGPEGRKSMFNGLADSIWAGTEHPDEAWEWMKYASSAECEAIVGSYGVVFPATAEGTQNALDVYSERGLDVSAFTSQATEDGGTFLFPVTDNASEVGDIMVEALDAIYLGQAPAADILPAANDAVNATFE